MESRAGIAGSGGARRPSAGRRAPDGPFEQCLGTAGGEVSGSVSSATRRGRGVPLARELAGRQGVGAVLARVRPRPLGGCASARAARPQRCRRHRRGLRPPTGPGHEVTPATTASSTTRAVPLRPAWRQPAATFQAAARGGWGEQVQGQRAGRDRWQGQLARSAVRHTVTRSAPGHRRIDRYERLASRNGARPCGTEAELRSTDARYLVGAAALAIALSACSGGGQDPAAGGDPASVVDIDFAAEPEGPEDSVIGGTAEVVDGVLRVVPDQQGGTATQIWPIPFGGRFTITANWGPRDGATESGLWGWRWGVTASPPG